MKTCKLCNESVRYVRSIGPSVKFQMPCPPAPDYSRTGISQGPVILFPVIQALDNLCYFHGKMERGLFKGNGGKRNILDYKFEERK